MRLKLSLTLLDKVCENCKMKVTLRRFLFWKQKADERRTHIQRPDEVVIARASTAASLRSVLNVNASPVESGPHKTRTHIANERQRTISRQKERFEQITHDWDSREADQAAVRAIAEEMARQRQAAEELAAAAAHKIRLIEQNQAELSVKNAQNVKNLEAKYQNGVVSVQNELMSLLSTHEKQLAYARSALSDQQKQIQSLSAGSDQQIRALKSDNQHLVELKVRSERNFKAQLSTATQKMHAPHR